MAIGVAVLFAVGCGDGGSGTGGDDQPPMIDAPGTQPDAAVPAGFTRLVGNTWSLTPGQLDTSVSLNPWRIRGEA